jgi:hypothetical protein
MFSNEDRTIASNLELFRNTSDIKSVNTYPTSRWQSRFDKGLRDIPILPNLKVKCVFNLSGNRILIAQQDELRKIESIKHHVAAEKRFILILIHLDTNQVEHLMTFSDVHDIRQLPNTDNFVIAKDNDFREYTLQFCSVGLTSDNAGELKTELKYKKDWPCSVLVYSPEKDAIDSIKKEGLRSFGNINVSLRMNGWREDEYTHIAVFSDKYILVFTKKGVLEIYDNQKNQLFSKPFATKPVQSMIALQNQQILLGLEHGMQLWQVSFAPSVELKLQAETKWFEEEYTFDELFVAPDSECVISIHKDKVKHEGKNNKVHFWQIQPNLFKYCGSLSVYHKAGLYMSAPHELTAISNIGHNLRIELIGLNINRVQESISQPSVVSSLPYQTGLEFDKERIETRLQLILKHEPNSSGQRDKILGFLKSEILTAKSEKEAICIVNYVYNSIPIKNIVQSSVSNFFYRDFWKNFCDDIRNIYEVKLDSEKRSTCIKD